LSDQRENLLMAKRRRLNEYRVDLHRVRRGERAITLDYPKNLGTRTKLGGEPTWIQDDETPECAQCGEPMHFVAQIDSIEHRSAHNPAMNVINERPKHIDFMFGDVGMIYVFYCFDCLEVQSLQQCY
jgi:uncharacterized protein YwqG